jgi:LytTr DNA-binding domain
MNRPLIIDVVFVVLTHSNQFFNKFEDEFAKLRCNGMRFFVRRWEPTLTANALNRTHRCLIVDFDYGDIPIGESSAAYDFVGYFGSQSNALSAWEKGIHRFFSTGLVQGYPWLLRFLQEALPSAAEKDSNLSTVNAPSAEKISIVQAGRVTFLDINEIYFLRSRNKAVLLYLNDGSVIRKFDIVLSQITDKYHEAFLRIHRHTSVSRRLLRCAKVQMNEQGRLQLAFDTSVGLDCLNVSPRRRLFVEEACRMARQVVALE